MQATILHATRGAFRETPCVGVVPYPLPRMTFISSLFALGQQQPALLLVNKSESVICTRYLVPGYCFFFARKQSEGPKVLTFRHANEVHGRNEFVSTGAKHREQLGVFSSYSHAAGANSYMVGSARSSAFDSDHSKLA